MSERADLFHKMFLGIAELEVAFGSKINPNIDSIESQENIKRVYANFSEEMAELYEAIFYNNPGDINYRKAILDELVDSGNFLISIFYNAGYQVSLECIKEYTPSSSYHDAVKFWFLETQVKVGLACNLLKNRPWKKMHVRTDITEFKKKMDEAISSFSCLGYILCSSVEEYEAAFERKFNINLERIKSNY